MKAYFAPAYAVNEMENPFSILGLSFDIIPEDNSVIINQDAEELFD
ncbi:MAG: hypothetical protein IKA02_03475 [Clostridia bacterium]|nr:hypothetical protein [Clostridia bacterium]